MKGSSHGDLVFGGAEGSLSQGDLRGSRLRGACPGGNGGDPVLGDLKGDWTKGSLWMRRSSPGGLRGSCRREIKEILPLECEGSLSFGKPFRGDQGTCCPGGVEKLAWPC